MIATVVTQGKTGFTEQNFDVSVVGMTLTVGAGSLVLEGVSHDLTELSHTVAASDSARQINFYLLLEKATGEVDLLVEELLDGDPGVDFKALTTHQLLKPLLFLALPGGATELNEGTGKLRRVLVPTGPTRVRPTSGGESDG